MDNNKKQQLASLFMYYFTIRNLEAYKGFPENPNEENIKAWANQFEGDKEAQEKVLSAFNTEKELWKEVEDKAIQMTSEVSEEDPEILIAKRGAYLRKMNTKKCKCGCDLVESKEHGGKLKCACGCMSSDMKAKLDRVKKAKKIKK